MEHIKQFDWCSIQPDSQYFIDEIDLDNSVTEKILRNKYYDPLISSESESEAKPNDIDWDEVFKANNYPLKRERRVYVAGMRPVPQYPKLSALSRQQHYQCLKVLCARHPRVLELEFVPRPTKQDHRVFEEVKSLYAEEQKQYTEWANTLWTNGHNVRALKPKPQIETVYEAELKMKANKLQSFPKEFEVVAQIPLETKHSKCEIVHQKDLINVTVTELPQIKLPELLSGKFTIMRPCPTPEPCNKHPCRFVLPTESAMSVLPLTEIHRELAQYAVDNGAQYVASEGALKCLVELDRAWLLPLSVCQVIGPDGDKSNIVVMGSEFDNTKQSAQVRTYKAFRHLLMEAFVPAAEKAKFLSSKDDDGSGDEETRHGVDGAWPMDADSDSDGEQLVIDAEDDMAMSCDEETKETEPTQMDQTLCTQNGTKDQVDTESPKDQVDTETSAPTQADTERNISKDKSKGGFYTCTCKDTVFEKPAPMSFRVWRVRNISANQSYDVVVHCSHKVRDKSEEVLLEPIPEYQLDLGGSEQSNSKINSLILSLHLRKNATVLNVRVDGATGDVVSCEGVTSAQLLAERGAAMDAVSAPLYAALDQLQGILPGHYLLRHEPSHGSNALLYACRRPAPGATSVADAAGAASAASAASAALDTCLRLQFDLAPVDESSTLRTPAIAPVLLPVHKFRKILPCAFTCHPEQVAREPKRPPAKQRVPPQAIKWPKRKPKKRRA